MRLLRYIRKIFGRGTYYTIDELRKMGLSIGNNVHIYTGHIDYNHGYLITIGDNTTLASDVTLIAHDASTKKILGYSKVGCITIGDNVFIGAQTIVLPNVKIGNHVVIGAGSVVTKDIPSNCVAVGNPCHVIGTYNDYVTKMKSIFMNAPKQETYSNSKSKKEKEEMKKALFDGGWGFDM